MLLMSAQQTENGFTAVPHWCSIRQLAKHEFSVACEVNHKGSSIVRLPQRPYLLGCR